MGFIRRSTAVWRGTGKEGSGTLSSTSGVLENTPYSSAARFVSEDGRAGTNPEELIAAAHAGCFSMALAFQLTNAGHPPEELRTIAHVSLDPGTSGFDISAIRLELTGKVPGITAAQFQELAEKAKAGCPVSRALKAVPITLDARI